ncbi:ERF family protein [uncultured Desulfovibrio sp.]|uniref:ERF family protein n=1 Tax=uncultured Desulfovibrio sp. TaxID=167968 RepID=UPI0026716C85|nr:ERF family protein [uncultured Desulfovibrio sp.]
MNSAYQSQDITELAKALLNVQRQLQPIPKDAENSFTKSWYASLKSVMAVCRDALLDNGIWLCQYPVPVDTPGCLGLVTKLTHAESGQWQSSLAVAPMPKADPQGMGSAITYARRYALTAMLSMVAEDDDGEGAKSGQKSDVRSKRATNAPQRQKAQNRNVSQGGDNFIVSKSSSTRLENLPQLEGIAYQIVTAQDGRDCIIATGNTQSRKEILSGAGFRWNAQRKVWWKYADAA